MLFSKKRKSIFVTLSKMANLDDIQRALVLIVRNISVFIDSGTDKRQEQNKSLPPEFQKILEIAKFNDICQNSTKLLRKHFIQNYL